MEITPTSITTTGLDYVMNTSGNGSWQWGSSTYIAFPADLPGVVSGTFTTEGAKIGAKTSIQHKFSKPFSKGPPVLLAGFSKLQYSHAKGPLRLKINYENVTKESVTFVIDTSSSSNPSEEGGLTLLRGEYIAFEQV